MEIVKLSIHATRVKRGNFGGCGGYNQGSQSRTGGCTDLANGTIYFGTSQYWCNVSGLPLFFIFINIYNKNKSLPLNITSIQKNYSWF